MGARRHLRQLAVWLLARTNPPRGRWAQTLLQALAGSASAASRTNAEHLRENLRRYFPGRDGTWVEATARAIQANAVQAKHFDKHVLPRLSTEQLDRSCEWVNPEPLTRAVEAGRGVVVTSLHYGRYWAAPVVLSRRGASVMAFQKAKGRLPAPALTLSGGTLDASDIASALRATRALRKGAVVALLLDAGRVQNPLVVDFLQQPTLVTASPIDLARAADAILVPVLAIATPDGPTPIQIRSYPEIDPRLLDPGEPAATIMRRVFACFEEQVRAEPSQWYGLATAHRRFAPKTTERATKGAPEGDER